MLVWFYFILSDLCLWESSIPRCDPLTPHPTHTPDSQAKTNLEFILLQLIQYLVLSHILMTATFETLLHKQHEVISREFWRCYLFSPYWQLSWIPGYQKKNKKTTRV